MSIVRSERRSAGFPEKSANMQGNSVFKRDWLAVVHIVVTRTFHKHDTDIVSRLIIARENSRVCHKICRANRYCFQCGAAVRGGGDLT